MKLNCLRSHRNILRSYAVKIIIQMTLFEYIHKPSACLLCHGTAFLLSFWYRIFVQTRTCLTHLLQSFPIFFLLRVVFEFSIIHAWAQARANIKIKILPQMARPQLCGCHVIGKKKHENNLEPTSV